MSDASPDVLELADADWLIYLLPSLDYQSQLAAIRTLLLRQQDVERRTNEEIQAIASCISKLPGIVQQQAVDDWVDHVHASVYQDAAHSMAAVGMIAPLIESVFYQVGIQLRDLYDEKQLALPEHPRFHEGDYAWDCHYVRVGKQKKTKDLIRGLQEMTTALGISEYLPEGLSMRLEALFAYRNKMFHYGFEWPMKERRAFAARAEAWPDDWFVWSRTGVDPWIAYLSVEYISETLDAVSAVLAGLGRFVRDLLQRG